MMGGDCNGRAFVNDTWDHHFGCGPCQECVFLDAADNAAACQILGGAEPFHKCPILIEHIARHEIRLYGYRYV